MLVSSTTISAVCCLRSIRMPVSMVVISVLIKLSVSAVGAGGYEGRRGYWVSEKEGG